MLFRFVVFLATIAGVLAQAPPAGTWTLKNQQRFAGDLVAADALRATFAQSGKPKVVIALKDLIPEDAEAIRTWRATHFRAPLIAPDALAPWPAQAMVEPATIQFIGKDGEQFTYESANFRLISDLKLPEPVVRDLATVFEATRSALMAIPLGLHGGGEKEKYPVLLKSTPEAYAALGGPLGSGGYYEGRTRRMLIFLPNLGIEEKGGDLKLNYGANLFVLKHEVAHQLIARWHGRLPIWMSEGLAEFVAALPYSRGHYELKNSGMRIAEYILKWRKSKDDRSITLIPAHQLMAMDDRAWRQAMSDQDSYALYNSATLLTYYFIQQEGGVRLAAYLDAARRGRNDAESELTKGKTREQLSEEVAALAKKLGLVAKP